MLKFVCAYRLVQSYFSRSVLVSARMCVYVYSFTYLKSLRVCECLWMYVYISHVYVYVCICFYMDEFGFLFCSLRLSVLLSAHFKLAWVNET